jgi:peptidoglycan/LPS O-acetylase OafA/YrhL
MTGSQIPLSDHVSEPLGNALIDRSSAKSSRYALLDCWRGVACLMVVFAHSSDVYSRKYVEGEVPMTGFAAHVVFFLSMLAVGVIMFFVISGYCISATVDGHGQRSKSVANYFSRRFWRIYPPYWAMFCLMTLAVGVLDFAVSKGKISGSLYTSQSPLKLMWSQLFGNVTLTETWRFHLFGGERILFLKHAWTLCYEEQFYLIVGLTLLFCPKAYFRSIIGVTIVSLGLVIATAFQLIDVTGFGVDLLWFPFALGVLVYYRLCYAKGHHTRAIDIGLAVLAILATSSCFLLWHWREPFYSIPRASASAAISALVLVSLHRWDAWLVTTLPFRLLASVGRISYSLYLVHAPIVPVLARLLYKAGFDTDLEGILVTIPLCAGISLPIAWVFFQLFERPFLHRKQSDIKI